MIFSHLKNPRVRGWSTVSSLMTIFAVLVCFQQQCQAKQPPELIAGEIPPQTAGGFGSAVGWIYSGLAVSLMAGTAVVVLRKNKARSRRALRPRTHVPVPAFNSNGHARPKSVSSRNDLSKPFRRRHRKRVYDYTKFYAKVIRNLSPYLYVPASTTSGISLSKGHVDHHGDHNSNGQTDSHTRGANQTFNSATEDLIAAQKSLIEEQKSLLDQQTRLIEEKRQLIEQQTASLNTQSSAAPHPRPYWPDDQKAA